jgi:hypothetical protein
MRSACRSQSARGTGTRLVSRRSAASTRQVGIDRIGFALPAALFAAVLLILDHQQPSRSQRPRAAKEGPMRYLMIHWIDVAALAGAESMAIESEVGAWPAEMDRRGVRLRGAAAVGQPGSDRCGYAAVTCWSATGAKTNEQIAGFDPLAWTKDRCWSSMAAA